MNWAFNAWNMAFIDSSISSQAHHVPALWRTEAVCLIVTQDHHFFFVVSRFVASLRSRPKPKHRRGSSVCGILSALEFPCRRQGTFDTAVARVQCGGSMMLLCALYVTNSDFEIAA